MPPKANTTPESRFWDKVNKTDNCWMWTAATNNKGYGNVRFGPRPGKLWLAHRYSWTISFGDIPKGLCVLHKCDTPLCVNPDHLFLGTKQDNSLDMTVKHRGTAKFTHEQINEILDLSKTIAIREIARRYKTNHSVIGYIVRGKTYRHITGIHQDTVKLSK